MSRATLVYIAVIILSAAGLWLIVRAGRNLRAATDLSGVWVVGGEDPAVPEQLGETIAIEQSGRFLRLNFERGLRVDVRLKDAPDNAKASENLEMLFEGPAWKLSAFGVGPEGPLIFNLSGPEKHTFTVTRRGAGGAAEAKAERASAAVPAMTTADADAEPAAATAAGTDAP